MTTLRVALLHLRVGVMNDLQYRVNFALQVLQSILAVGVGLIVFQLVFSHTQELNGWTHSELLAILGVQAVMAGVVHAVIQPNMMRLSEEVQRREARSRTDEARRRADADQRAPGSAVAGGRHPDRRRDHRLRARAARRRRGCARRARVRRSPRVRRRAPLLLLARPRDRLVLGRAHVVHCHGALRGRLPDGPLSRSASIPTGCASGSPSSCRSRSR